MTLETFAKLNLCLWVYPPDTTNYHPIRSIFQSISLHDQISIRHTREKKCIIVCDTADIPLDETNSMAKAYSMLKERLSFGIRLLVEKNIPIGGGLGGGSSNAAGILQYLNSYCQPKYSLDELVKIATKIGSDVPYFLHGGTAYVTGYGEKIRPNEVSPTKDFLLVCPQLSVSTAEVYKAFDKYGIRRKFNSLCPSLKRDLGQNDLQPVAFRIHPGLQALELRLKQLGVRPVCMTGSGSTLYIPLSSTEEGHLRQSIVRENCTNVRTYLTSTQSCAYRLIESV